MAILMDVSPLAGGHGQRGIGRYVRGLLEASTHWPADRRESLWGIGLPELMPPELGARTLVYRRLGFRPLDVGWLTCRTAMASALRRVPARAIHSTDPYHPWVPSGPRRVTTAYDLIPLSEPQMLSAWRPNHRWGYRQFLRQIQRSDLVIAISQVTAEAVSDRLGVAADRIAIVYPLVSAPPPLERRPAAEASFLFVGGLDDHKRPELAVQALAAFRRSTGGGMLRFVGPASAARRASLLELAGRLGSADAISFSGHISDDALDAAYSTATALLWTSKIEGFGLPPVEALARGVPVIAVDTPAARETIGVHVGLVEPDPEAIAQAMLNPSAPRPGTRESILARYSPAATAAALWAAYERVG